MVIILLTLSKRNETGNKKNQALTELVSLIAYNSRARKKDKDGKFFVYGYSKFRKEIMKIIKIYSKLLGILSKSSILSLIT